MSDRINILYQRKVGDRRVTVTEEFNCWILWIDDMSDNDLTEDSTDDAQIFHSRERALEEAIATIHTYGFGGSHA